MNDKSTTVSLELTSFLTIFWLHNSWIPEWLSHFNLYPFGKVHCMNIQGPTDVLS